MTAWLDPMRTRLQPFSLWLADRQSHRLPAPTTRPQSRPEYIGLRKQPRRIYYTPLHASSLPLRSADALLDLPYFALGRRLAGQSRVPVLLGRLVTAFSLFPPGSIGVLHADLPGIALTNIDPYRVALPFKIHMIDFRDRAYLVFDILVDSIHLKQFGRKITRLWEVDSIPSLDSFLIGSGRTSSRNPCPHLNRVLRE